MPFRYNLPMLELPPDFVGGSGPIRLARFLLKEHDGVEPGTPVAEVAVGDAVIQVEANGRGVLLSKVAKPGDSIGQGETIAVVGADGEEIPYGRPYSLARVVKSPR